MAITLLTGCDSESSTRDASTSPASADTAAETTPPAADTTAAADAQDATAPADSAAPAPDGAIVLPTERPPIKTTHTTSIGDWTMNPGRETTRCVVKRLGNTEESWVTQVRTSLAKGSHHMIVYISDETEERAEPFNCTPFVETLGGQTFPLMITQIAEETLTFPNGVAFRFEPNQMVRIEAHFLNYFQEPITAHGDVHFDTIAAKDVASEANMLFYGNPDFEVPPRSTFTTDWRYLSVPAGTQVFAVTGHTHQWGTNVEIYKADGMDDEGVSIYPQPDAPFQWDEAPVATFDPALLFEEGQGFRYRCSWDNGSDEKLRFGESANREMCFFWAYYYPSDGYRLCVNPGSIGGGAVGNEICCPGSFICSLISDFINN